MLLLLILSCSSLNQRYPSHWWKPVPKSELQWWEIGPQDAKEGQVILSKRNELGILSNFADTPFTFRGKKYATVEGLWQSMKYPENKNDPRYKMAKWPYERSSVEQMQGFAAKEAGDFASKVMKDKNIDWVTFEGKKIIYRENSKGEFYNIILDAMMEKLKQNPKVKSVLVSTGDLELKADHFTKATDPPAWKYYQIWMDIRSKID